MVNRLRCIAIAWTGALGRRLQIVLMMLENFYPSYVNSVHKLNFISQNTHNPGDVLVPAALFIQLLK